MFITEGVQNKKMLDHGILKATINKFTTPIQNTKLDAFLPTGSFFLSSSKRLKVRKVF